MKTQETTTEKGVISYNSTITKTTIITVHTEKTIFNQLNIIDKKNNKVDNLKIQVCIKKGQDKKYEKEIRLHKQKKIKDYLKKNLKVVAVEIQTNNDNNQVKCVEISNGKESNISSSVSTQKNSISKKKKLKNIPIIKKFREDIKLLGKKRKKIAKSKNKKCKKVEISIPTEDINNVINIQNDNNCSNNSNYISSNSNINSDNSESIMTKIRRDKIKLQKDNSYLSDSINYIKYDPLECFINLLIKPIIFTPSILNIPRIKPNEEDKNIIIEKLNKEKYTIIKGKNIKKDKSAYIGSFIMKDEENDLKVNVPTYKDKIIFCKKMPIVTNFEEDNDVQTDDDLLEKEKERTFNGLDQFMNNVISDNNYLEHNMERKFIYDGI